MGNFYLREEHSKPIIMLASGTGFAPIKSIINYANLKKIDRPIHFYWGARKKIDLYEYEVAQEMIKNHLNLDFIPVLSEPTAECQWNGRTGNVHEAVMSDHPNLQGYEVYACGAPIMVESAKFDFIEKCKLNPRDFYADSFISMADQVA
jgi:CDP-4-dehydro-6-deoxyglucose reductase